MTVPEMRPPSPTEQHLKVLLVDDVDDLRLLMRTLFEAYPDITVVGEAADGLAAIEVAERTQPDLIVLDLSMPVMDGLSALPELARVAPDARVVVLTAIPRSFDPGAMRAGAVAYVEKSVSGAHQLVPDLLAGAGLLDAVVGGLSVERDARTRLAASATSPRAARRFARQALSGHHEDVVDVVELLLTELVTNAVLHANSRTAVSLQVFPDRVHVEVVDGATRAGRPQHPTPDSESGRGMELVDALASSWGTTALADGKIVWFDVARTATAPVA